MASKSGTLVFSNGGKGVVSLTVEWSSTGNDSNNTSTVSASVYVTASASGNALSGSYLSINGNRLDFTRYINSGSNVAKHFLASHTVTVSHDGDGNATIPIAACLVWNGYMWNGSGATIGSIDGSSNVSLQQNSVGTPPTNTTISLSNTGVAEGNVTATANTSVAQSAGTVQYRFSYSTNGGSSWTETAWSTSNSYSLNVTNISRGSLFHVRAEAKNNRGSSGWSSTKTVRANSAPSIPINLSVDNTRVVGNCVMTWQHCTDADGHKITYKVYIKKNNGGWTYLGSTKNNTYTYNSSSDAYGTKYNYRVEAYDSLGAYSSEDSGEFIKATPPSSVALTLNKNSVAEGNVIASASSLCQYPRGTTQYQFSYYYDGIGWQDQAWSTSKTATFDVTKKRGATWHFRVRAKNDAGTSSWASEKNIVSNSLPTVVEGLTHAPKYPIDSITLKWNPSSDANNNAITYKVYLQKNGESWSLIKSTTETSITYNNSADAFNTRYKFKVEAYDTFNVCAPAKESAEFFKPTPPTSPIHVHPTNSYYELNMPVKWNLSNFYTLSGYYVVEQKINGGDWISHTSKTTLSSFTFPIDSIQRGDTIQFRVKAVNEAGQESSWSTGAIAKRNRLPNAVTNIQPSGGYMLDIINFTWDAATDPDGQNVTYSLYISKNGGSFEHVYDTTSTSFAWAIPGRDPGEYSYRLKIVTIDTLGATNEAIGPLILKPTPPTNPTNLGPASGYFENHIDLTWTHSNWFGQEGKYMIKIFVDGILNKEVEVPHTSNVYRFGLTGIPRGNKISYNIRAKNTFNQQSELVLSSVNLYHNHIPEAPVIIAPLTNSTLHSRTPKMVLKTARDEDNQRMSLNVKYNGSVYNSKTHPQFFSKETVGNEEYVIFKHNQSLSTGTNTFEVTANDGLINSSSVSISVNIENNITSVAVDEIITAQDYNDRLLAIDNTRKAYGLSSYNLTPITGNVNYITAAGINNCISAIKELTDKIDSYHIGNKFAYNNVYQNPVKNETFIASKHFNQISNAINAI